MTAIDRPTGESIARLMANLRPDWDYPGCVAAVKAVARRPPGDTALAAVRLAMNPDAKTPAALAVLDGQHWREKVSPIAHRHPPRMHEECRQHPGEWADACRVCASERLAPVVQLPVEYQLSREDALAEARRKVAEARMTLTSDRRPWAAWGGGAERGRHRRWRHVGGGMSEYRLTPIARLLLGMDLDECACPSDECHAAGGPGCAERVQGEAGEPGRPTPDTRTDRGELT